ncbi:hypothetical protein RUND412_008794 [Rhizina undulata]
MAAATTASASEVTMGESAPAKFEVVVEKKPRNNLEMYDIPEGVEWEASGGQPEEEEIKPAYYYEDMGIPVFKPTMDQFRSFKDFVDKINPYGMQRGIVKVIPPPEWYETLAPLDEKVKEIRIKNPIIQHIAGISGEYRQTNLEKQRTYNLVQWRQLCEGSDHQPPARRGERRRGQAAKDLAGGRKTRRKSGAAAANAKDEKEEEDGDVHMEDHEVMNGRSGKANPLTPSSPGKLKGEDAASPESFREPPSNGGRQPRRKSLHESTPDPAAELHGRQPRQKKKYVRKSAKQREAERELADDEDFEGFDYRVDDADEYTPERCDELEKAYWRTLTYNNPLYGADMPGSLFEDRTTSWNVAKLDNLLDCLGKKLPGVNTAYLYLGMWKSTFAWHLEDMDLYSINYIHFGAPKQWYSISREDKPKFEQVMKSIWPNDAKKCTEFLRHKTYLVSPSLLAQHGIKVNKLVHHQGEFVITFPYGYHSGYNLGYNCAESVNFATNAWLDYGRIAKKCDCVGDSVWVDVEEIERKLRGEPTEDEYEEVEYDEFDEEDNEDNEEEEEGTVGDLPTPPESVEGKLPAVKPKKSRKRGNEGGEEQPIRVKRLKLKFSKTPVPEPCILCPNNIPSEELVDAGNGQKAHRLCAIYTPETGFQWDQNLQRDVITNMENIPKARYELKCIFCRSKKGACFQCSSPKCTRAYHATCAFPAGVLVTMVDVNMIGEDGRLYHDVHIDFRCKFHRPKRPKNIDIDKLEEDPLIRTYARNLIRGDTVQMQFLKGEIFAGVVVENRPSEEMVLIDILPKGGLCEIDWKWLLPLDPEAHIPGPMPQPTAMQLGMVASQALRELPQTDDPFCDTGSGLTWAELHIENPTKLVDQAPVDPNRPYWHYLGELSTEYIAKYTDDPRKRVPNDAASVLPAKRQKSRVTKTHASHHAQHAQHAVHQAAPIGLPAHPSYNLYQQSYGQSYVPGTSFGASSSQAPVALMGSEGHLPPQQLWPPVYRPTAPVATMGPPPPPHPVNTAHPVGYFQGTPAQDNNAAASNPRPAANGTNGVQAAPSIHAPSDTSTSTHTANITSFEPPGIPSSQATVSQSPATDPKIDPALFASHQQQESPIPNDHQKVDPATEAAAPRHVGYLDTAPIPSPVTPTHTQSFFNHVPESTPIPQQQLHSHDHPMPPANQSAQSPPAVEPVPLAKIKEALAALANAALANARSKAQAETQAEGEVGTQSETKPQPQANEVQAAPSQA